MERTYPPAPAVHTFSTKQLGGARYLLPQRGWEWMERGEGRGILQDSLKKHFFRFRTGLIILSSDAPGRGSWYNRPCPAIHTHVHTCMPCTCTDMHTRTHTDAHTHAHTWCVHAHYMNGRVRLVFTGHRSQGKRELSVYLGSCSS